jgi:iron(III) transport system ATP-binding protein
MIEVSHLSKTFVGGQVAALNDVSITMEHGSFFTLLGPSGCGKTTLLRCIAGLETPDEGEIRIDGKVVFSRSADTDVPINQRKIGMVFQSYAIWPHMTVFENVAFPLRAQGLADIDSRVGTALTAVHLEAMAQRPATRLSGGQQQRVALARAIVAEPSVLLLDEPLSNLDASLREQMRTEMGALQQRLGLTTVLVTHDQEEALSLSDRIALLHAGKVVEQGTPHTLYYEPRSSFAAEFIGAANLVDGVAGEATDGLTAIECAFGKLWTTAPVKPGPAKLFIRPEKIMVKSAEAHDPGRNVYMGQVRSRRFVGASTDADIVVDSGVVLRIRSSGDVPRDACMVVIDPADIKVIRLVD